MMKATIQTMSQLTSPLDPVVGPVLACVHCAKSKAKCDRKVIKINKNKMSTEARGHRAELYCILDTVRAMRGEETHLQNESVTTRSRAFIIP